MHGGRLGGHYWDLSLTPACHWPVLSHKVRITARETGKRSSVVFLGLRGNGFAVNEPRLCHRERRSWGLRMRKSLRGDPRVGSGYNGKGTCREEMKV